MRVILVKNENVGPNLLLRRCTGASLVPKRQLALGRGDRPAASAWACHSNSDGLLKKRRCLSAAIGSQEHALQRMSAGSTKPKLLGVRSKS